jgi:hypothetical protein
LRNWFLSIVEPAQSDQATLDVTNIEHAATSAGCSSETTLRSHRWAFFVHQVDGVTIADLTAHELRQRA